MAWRLTKVDVHAGWNEAKSDANYSAMVSKRDHPLTPQGVAHFGVDEIPVENVEAVGVFHRWKVRKLTLLDG